MVSKWHPPNIRPVFSAVQAMQQWNFQPQMTPVPLGLDLAARCDVLLGSLLQNRLGRCRSVGSGKRSIFPDSQPSFPPSLSYPALFRLQRMVSCLHHKTQLEQNNYKGCKCPLFHLRTQGIAVSKSAVQVQLRHLAVWLMLLLLLKTQPFGQV